VKQTYDVWRNGDKDRRRRAGPAGQHRSALDPELRGARRLGGPDAGNGTKLFAGQRDDAFFVDLGSIFDLAGLRPFNPAHAISLPAAPGIDDVGGFNTNSIAILVPLDKLTKDHALPTGPNDPDAVLGVWASASRQRFRSLKP
jgi:hypothetical protein